MGLIRFCQPPGDDPLQPLTHPEPYALTRDDTQVQVIISLPMSSCASLVSEQEFGLPQRLIHIFIIKSIFYRKKITKTNTFL